MDRKTTLQEKYRVQLTTLPFATQYNPSVISLEKDFIEQLANYGEATKASENF